MTPPNGSADLTVRCAACAASLTGRYCATCGERRHAPDDERLGAFLRDQFREATSVDGKLWQTLRALFVPGKLTAEFFEGRRRLYVRPIRLFLTVNVVLFFLLSGNPSTVLKGPLRTNYRAMLYGPVAERMAEHRAEAWGTDLETVETAFDAHASGLAPSLLGVMIPAFALLFGLVLWPVRASGVRHLVLATHAVSVLLAGAVLLVLLLSLGVLLVRAVTRWPVDSIDPVLVPAVILSFAAYLVGSIRRVYRIRWIAAVAAGVAVGIVGTAMAFWGFRMVLFFVAMATLNPPA